MLASIWHLRGAAPILGSLSDREILDRVQRLLLDERKPVTDRDTTRVRFDSPLWRDAFELNWGAMVMYDRGAFRIVRESGGRVLAYDLRSLHGFLFCLFAAAGFSIFGYANGGVSGALRYAAFGFFWLYGVNLALAWSRVPRVIRGMME